MEALFKHNGKIYRIDGVDPKELNCFWGEQLKWDESSEDFEPTENYGRFSISGLIDAQAEALKQALKQTVEED